VCAQATERGGGEAELFGLIGRGGERGADGFKVRNRGLGSLQRDAFHGAADAGGHVGEDLPHVRGGDELDDFRGGEFEVILQSAEIGIVAEEEDGEFIETAGERRGLSE
jgi:hypothetical protein